MTGGMRTALNIYTNFAQLRSFEMQPKIDVAACRSALGNGKCSADRYRYSSLVGGDCQAKPSQVGSFQTPNTRAPTRKIFMCCRVTSQFLFMMLQPEIRHTTYMYMDLCMCVYVCMFILQPNVFNRLRASHTFRTLNAEPPFLRL